MTTPQVAHGHLLQTKAKYYCSRKCELKTMPFNSTKSDDNDIFNTTEKLLTTALKAPFISRLDNHMQKNCDSISKKPNIYCSYLDQNQISNAIGKKEDISDLLVYHANVSSLTKNLHRVEELFRDCANMPDILGISETRLKDDTFLVALQGYKFESHHSPTEAGGVGIYIRNHLQYNVRDDISIDSDHCEEKWVEIIVDNSKNQRKNTKYIVIGIIYRHPVSNYKSFQEKLCKIIYSLNQNNTSVLIMGDLNINLLKYNLTNPVTDYLNCVQSVGCLSFINEPTRVYLRGSRWETSCIDHLYSNIDPNKIDAYIIESDVSDHFSIMARIKGIKNINTKKTQVYKRKQKLSETEIENLNAELGTILQRNNAFHNVNSVNEKTTSIIDTYTSLIDRYMPLRKLSRKQKALHFKPWYTKGINISIRTENNLKKESLRLKGEDSVKRYKKYRQDR